MPDLRPLPPCFALLLAGLGLAGPLTAQDLVPPRRSPARLIPYVGGHSAGQVLLTDGNGGGGWQAGTGLLYGVRLEVPVRSRLAIAADVGYATIPIDGFGSGYQGFEADGNFLSVTGRAVLNLTPPRSLVSFAVNAGGGLMRHWVRSPYPRYSTEPAAVVGAQIGVPLSRTMVISLLAESFFYTAKFEFPTTASAGQQDWRLGVGMQVPLR